MFCRHTMALLAILLCTLGVAAAQAPQQLTPFTADLQFSTSRELNAPTDLKGKIYVGNDRMRMETAIAQWQSITISDFGRKTVYTLDPTKHLYIEHRFETSRSRRPPGWADLRPMGENNDPCAGEQGTSCKKIGVEEINGRACEHWELTERNGRVTQIWVDQKIHFPGKIVNQRATWQLSNVREEKPDPAVFQIPEGYHRFGGAETTPASPPPQ
jgi:hypothetical protein